MNNSEAMLKQVKDPKGIVTLTDDEGATFQLRETVYSGERILHDPLFPNMGTMLASLPSYKVRNDDVWLLTYPKAGTHWVQEILGILLSGKLESSKKEKISCMLEMIPDIAMFEAKESPRILNTHINARFLPNSMFEKARSVIVVRNPKSIAVSGYQMLRGIKEVSYSGTFNGFFSQFCNADGFFTLSGATWFSYYCTLWEKQKNNPNVKFIFYEDLIKDPVPVVQELARFLGLDRSKEFCEQVAELASFENMKVAKGKSVKTQEFMKFLTKELYTTPFIRKGQITDWKNTFTVAQNEAFDEIYKKEMEKYPDLAKKIQFC